MTKQLSYEDVLDVYVRLGFPREVVTHWTLPKADVDGLLKQFDTQVPLNILEVGTFVGLSTLLIAAHCHPDSHIHTVDPNFPLAVELGAMKTPLLDCDANTRQQELAQRAAAELGLAGRISFHVGGFATGATFASAKANADFTVPVVGPAVCAEHGPFDVIFLDGLHYTSTVLSDLRLAQAHLAEGGRIVLHDVIGRWGSNVRRAAWRFVEENPGFRFRHGRYTAIYDAIGVVERDSHTSAPPATPLAQTNHPGLENPDFCDNLATVIVNHCHPARVAMIGTDRWGLAASLARASIAEISMIGDDEAPARRLDLVILVDAACTDFPGGLSAAVAVATKCTDAVLLVSTPPGEDTAPVNARPVGWWARQFLASDFALHDQIRPDFEPTRFAYSLNTLYQTASSLACNLYLAKRMPVNERDDWLADMLVEKERRIEDLTVQGVYTDILLRDTVQKWISAADHYQRALQEIERIKGEQSSHSDESGKPNRTLTSRLLQRLRGLVS